MDRQKQLGTENIRKLLLAFSLPSIVGMLVNALYTIVDRIYIGHMKGVGGLAISGVGLTLPITTIILAFGMLIGIGASASISIRLGQKKKDEAEHILGNAFVLLFICSIILTVVGLIGSDAILKALGSSNDTLPYAKEFINVLLLGTIFNCVGFGMNAIIRAEGNPKVSMITMLIGAILNIILEPIFIFVLDMGIKGAATATVISQAVSFVWIMKYFLGGGSTLRLKKENLKLDFKIMESIFAIGMAPFSIQIAASIVSMIANKNLETYGGDLAIGSMAIINSITLVFLMPIFGLNQGCQPIIGYNYGAKSYDRVKDTVKTAAIAASVLCIIGFSFVEILPKVLIHSFTKDAELVSITVHGIRIYLCMMPFIGFQIISSNFFQCIGKAKISMFLSLLRQVILLIPLMMLLPHKFGVDGIWYAGGISDLTATIITALFFLREIRNLKEPNTVQCTIDN